MGIQDLLDDHRLSDDQKAALVKGAKDTAWGVASGMNPAIGINHLYGQGLKASGLEDPVENPSPPMEPIDRSASQTRPTMSGLAGGLDSEGEPLNEARNQLPPATKGMAGPAQ